MTRTSSEAITVAARELFRNRGYAGASMKDLADLVGLQKASLYSRVPDKEALVAKVLDLTLAELFDFDAHSMDWRQAFTMALRRMAAHVRDRRRCVALHLAYGLPEDAEEGRAAVNAFFTECRDRLAAMLSGGMAQDLADELATEAVARIEGATLWLVVSGNDAPLERALASICAQAEALAMDVPDPNVRRHLDGVAGGWQRASAMEKALAARLAETEERLCLVEQALRGEIEAESCFR